MFLSGFVLYSLNEKQIKCVAATEYHKSTAHCIMNNYVVCTIQNKFFFFHCPCDICPTVIYDCNI